MKLGVLFGLTIVLALPRGNAVAAEAPDVCSLLSAAEIEAAVGMKVSPSKRVDGPMPSERLKEQMRLGCSWQVGAAETDPARKGGVFLSTVRLASAEQQGAGLAFLRETVATLKSVGYSSTETTLGGTTCVVATPPKERVKLGTNTSCSIEAKSLFVAINAEGAVGRTKPESVKGLLDKAVSRLP